MKSPLIEKLIIILLNIQGDFKFILFRFDNYLAYQNLNTIKEYKLWVHFLGRNL